MNKTEFLDAIKTEFNLNITPKISDDFEIYKDLLKEYNQKFNLTSIVEDDEIYLKHFYDSLCILKTNKINSTFFLLDIGTGAGFPGIPIAIVNNEINITLVESNTKKCEFLKVVKEKLNLNNINIINMRAEEYVQNNREKFDIVTSRAVSHLKVLLELEIPALKVNGYMLSLKANITEEIKESDKLLKELNCNLETILEYSLPKNAGIRNIPIIKKTKETNKKYPRSYSKIIKDLKK